MLISQVVNKRQSCYFVRELQILFVIGEGIFVTLEVTNITKKPSLTAKCCGCMQIKQNNFLSWNVKTDKLSKVLKTKQHSCLPDVEKNSEKLSHRLRL